MTRLIKFRAWDKQQLRMSLPFSLGDSALFWFLDADCPMPLEFATSKGRVVFQQFTGLADSTGKEIYEGDFVKWDDASDGKYWRVAKVIWNERGGWTFRTIPSQCIGSCTQYERDFNLTNFIYSPNPSEHGNVLVIIGNIHQNPNLLN